MKGILNINKPGGITSHDVISKVRKILGEKTVGHMGTLDPQGTGVLLIGVGKAARLFSYYLNKDKVYEAEFEFGYETDTLDKDGKITNTIQNIPTKKDILEAVKLQTGKINQMPPLYSAKKIDGKKAYDLARQNIEFTIKPVEIEIFSINFLENIKPNIYKFRIHCSSGTYIRSICRDLAYSLNSLATMISICRTKASDFCIENAISLEELAIQKEAALISVEKALENAEKIVLTDDYYEKLLKGIKIPFSTDKTNYTVYCKGELFGLGKIKDGFLKIDTYLRD